MHGVIYYSFRMNAKQLSESYRPSSMSTFTISFMIKCFSFRSHVYYLLTCSSACRNFCFGHATSRGLPEVKCCCKKYFLEYFMNIWPGKYTNIHRNIQHKNFTNTISPLLHAMVMTLLDTFAVMANVHKCILYHLSYVGHRCNSHPMHIRIYGKFHKYTICSS